MGGHHQWQVAPGATDVEVRFNLLDDGLVGQQIFAGEATRLAYMTDEAVEGRDAFLEKRDPDRSFACVTSERWRARWCRDRPGQPSPLEIHCDVPRRWSLRSVHERSVCAVRAADTRRGAGSPGMPMDEAMRTSARCGVCTSARCPTRCCCLCSSSPLKAPTSSNSQDWHYVVVGEPGPESEAR